MELVYVASFLLCCMPLLTTGAEEDALQFEVKISPPDPVFAADLSKTLLLTCDAQSQGDVGDQTPVLKWFFNDQEITSTNFQDRVRINGDHSKLKLIFNGVIEDDGGLYRCDGTLAGQEDSKSITIEIFQAPEVQSPESQDGIAGKDGTLECIVTGKPQPTLTWKFENGDNIPNSDKYIINSDNTLTIKDLTLEDDKAYICYLEVETRAIFEQFTIDFTVAVPPKIDDVIRVSPTNPKVDETVTLTCIADGVPTPTIFYKKENNMVDDSMVSSGVLTIDSLSHEDEATYYCFATNLGGSANMSIFLDVQIPPTVTISMLAQGEAGDPVEGQTVSIKCEAEGDPEPTVSWEKDSATAPYDGTGQNEPRLEKESGNDPTDAKIKHVSQTMVFDSIRYSDAGKYICKASNRVGDTVEETTISIKYPPKFTTDYDETMFYGWRGHEANLTCQATANPTPTYRWFKSEDGIEPGEEIQTGGPFTIASQNTWEEYKLSSSSLLIKLNADSASMYAKYICEATNTVSETRSLKVVELKEAYAPSAPTVTVTKTLTTMVQINFLPPNEDQNGGQPVTGFTYKVFPAANPAQAITGNIDLAGGEGMAEVHDLAMNTDYKVVGQAVNNVGPGAEVEQPFKTLDVSRPFRLVLESEKDGEDDSSYTLKWADPVDGEDPITQYTIKYTAVEVTINDLTDEWDLSELSGKEIVKIVPVTSTIKEYTITNLKKDTYYQVQVTAKNGVGVSDPAVMLFKTSAGAPGDEDGDDEEKEDGDDEEGTNEEAENENENELGVDDGGDVNVSQSKKPAQGGGDPAGSGGLSSGAVLGIILVLALILLAVGLAVYFIRKRKPELAGRLRLAGGGGEEESGKAGDGKSPAEEEKLIKKDDAVKVESETGDVTSQDVVEDKPQEFDPDTKPSSDTPAPGEAPTTEVKVTPETPEKPEQPTA